MPPNKAILPVCAGLLWKNDCVLIAQRAEAKHKGAWEFPGGKIETDESPEGALKRELKEELDLDCTIGDFFMLTTHALSNKTIELHTYQVIHFEGQAKALIHNEIRWVKVDELKSYQVLPADIPVVDKLLEQIHVN